MSQDTAGTDTAGTGIVRRDAGGADAARSDAADAAQSDGFRAAVRELATQAREAQGAIRSANRNVKDAALRAMATSLREHSEQIIAANAIDLERERAGGMSEGLVDRLALTEARIEAIAAAVEDIAALPDPVGQIVDGQTLPNGLRVRRQRVPMGVVGVIYEARPNVTVDVVALALKSGNAVILRGGSAAERSNEVIIAALHAALRAQGLPEALVSTVDPWGRDGATAMMQARGFLDVLVPRGGAGLIAAVVENSKVPVIETGSGNCHIYVDATADLERAVEIVVNAKTQRVGVCNAAETLLVHEDAAADFLPKAAAALWERGTTLHADAETLAYLAPLGPGEELVPATETDWETEYGSLDLAVAVVPGVDEATEHIRRYTTGHTEAILAEDTRTIERFKEGVDSAAIMVNASTRFTDGGELGLGAELGISTQKLHARGPMGLEALTTVQWIVEGEGHIRP